MVHNFAVSSNQTVSIKRSITNKHFVNKNANLQINTTQKHWSFDELEHILHKQREKIFHVTEILNGKYFCLQIKYQNTGIGVDLSRSPRN